MSKYDLNHVKYNSNNEVMIDISLEISPPPFQD